MNAEDYEGLPMGIPKDVQKKLSGCCLDIASIVDNYFPELRETYGNEEFKARLMTVMYIELIHAGYFK